MYECIYFVHLEHMEFYDSLFVHTAVSNSGVVFEVTMQTFYSETLVAEI